MNTQKSPQQNTNPKLESDTFTEKLSAPVLLTTFDGLKEVSVERVDKYALKTNIGILQKDDLIFALHHAAMSELGEGARIDEKIAAQKMRTANKIKDRPKVLNDEILQSAVDKGVQTTMLSGHVFYGILVEYNKWNLLLNVNNHTVLIYRHAVYQFEVK